MIPLYLLGVLFMIFVGVVRLVNWVRYRNRGFSLMELLVAVSMVAAVLGLWIFSRHVGQ
jgi:prepilin-type N-terminal cleavage/methylation domain-containing protein